MQEITTTIFSVIIIICILYFFILKYKIHRIKKVTGWSASKAFVVWQLEHVYIADYGVTKAELYEKYAHESAKILFDNIEKND